MFYGDIVKQNNPVAFQIIKNAFNQNKIAHAFLFSAPKNVNIEAEPLFLIQSLISENPFDINKLRSIDSYADLTIIDGNDSLIKKDLITEAALKLQETPLEEKGVKILYIKNLENANKQSLNSLLKFIEEPTPDTYIIMTTNNVNQILSTIRSRSQVISLRAQSKENLIREIANFQVPEKYASILASIAATAQEAKDIFGQDFDVIYKHTIEVLGDSVFDKNKLFTEMINFINKNNFRVSIELLRVFFEDVWKTRQGLRTSFNEDEILNKFALSKFKFDEALKTIDEYFVAQEYNVNFDLSKAELLINLVRSYE